MLILSIGKLFEAKILISLWIFLQSILYTVIDVEISTGMYTIRKVEYIRRGERIMSEKRKVAVYRRAANKSQIMNEEKQKKLIRESDFCIIEDHFDNSAQEEKNVQFEKMIVDVKDKKVADVTLLEREGSNEKGMERLKRVASEAEIPLYVYKNNEIKK